jgi:hypothetical protein
VGLDKVIFGLPTLIAAAPGGGFVVADQGYRQVRSFGADGRERWSTGRLGQGPGEFQSFSDIQVSGDGSVTVLDPVLGRITEFSADGDLRSTTRTPRPVNRLFPSFHKGEWAVAPQDTSTLWLSVTRDGLLGDHSQALPSEVSFAHALAGEPFTTSSERGAIVVYRWSSKIVYLDEHGSVRGVQDGVEPVRFPDVKSYGISGAYVTRIDPAATWAARSVTAHGGKVYVLFRGATVTEGNSTIDTYDERTMKYIGSYRLPSAVSEIAALANGDLATIDNSFIPVVKVWRITSIRSES